MQSLFWSTQQSIIYREANDIECLSAINGVISWSPKRTNVHSSAVLRASIFRGGSIETKQQQENKKRLVLLIDDDNTLYSEKELVKSNIDNQKLDLL